MIWGLEYDTWVQVAIAVIALLALFRPELEKRTHYFFNKIDFYPYNNIEIGYFDFGPTIGIPFTLRARVGDQLVSTISLKIVRLRDNATYNFQWRLFRDYEAIITNAVSQNENVKIELANAFLLPANTSKTLNVQFHDINTKERFADSVLRLKTGFEKFLNSIPVPPQDITQLDQAQQLFKQDDENNALVLDAYSILGKQMYWEEGDYKLQVIVNTENPNKEFSYCYGFGLTQEQVNQLDVNRLYLTLAAMKSNISPNFVNSNLEKI